MNLGICAMASSSSGNCFLVKSEKTNILVDAGLSGKKVVANLAALDVSPSKIDAILITHEHADHVKYASSIRNKVHGAPIMATAGTAGFLKSRSEQMPREWISIVESGKSFELGDVCVTPVATSHDAQEPVAYIFERNGKKISLVTDTGVMTPELTEAVRGSDIMVIESNHEVNILLYGSYPYSLKQRILGEKGHLSNEAAGNFIRDFVADLGGAKTPYIMLAHLSKENNTPAQAFLTVRNILEEAGYYVGRDLKLETVSRDDMGNLIIV